MHARRNDPAPLEPVGPLAELGAEEWAALTTEMREVVVPVGTALMHQDEPGEWFAILVEGAAEVTRTDSSGTHRLATVGPGSVLGEIALLTGERRSATVIATEPLRAFVGGIPAFAHLVENEHLHGTLGRTAAQRLATHATTTRVQLDGGSEIDIRPGLRDDREQLVRGLEELSDESRRRRFFTGGAVPERVIDYLVDIDYVDHFAWVAADDPEDRIVGSARYIRDAVDPTTAEIAFGVLDDYQRHGIGSLLVGALAATAPAAGITQFSASMLRENSVARHMLDRLDVEWATEEPGVTRTMIGVDEIRRLLDPALADQLSAVGTRLITASHLALT